MEEVKPRMEEKRPWNNHGTRFISPIKSRKSRADCWSRSPPWTTRNNILASASFTVVDKREQKEPSCRWQWIKRRRRPSREDRTHSRSHHRLLLNTLSKPLRKTSISIINHVFPRMSEENKHTATCSLARLMNEVMAWEHSSLSSECIGSTLRSIQCPICMISWYGERQMIFISTCEFREWLKSLTLFVSWGND